MTLSTFGTHSLVQITVTPTQDGILTASGKAALSLWLSDSTGYKPTQVLMYGNAAGTRLNSELSAHDGSSVQLDRIGSPYAMWAQVNTDSTRTGRAILNFRSNDINNTDIHIPINIISTPSP